MVVGYLRRVVSCCLDTAEGGDGLLGVGVGGSGVLGRCRLVAQGRASALIHIVRCGCTTRRMYWTVPEQ